MDLDFERAVRPPPQPTEEATASLEDLIRKRIADHNFDDVPRAAPPAPERHKRTLDLSDQKSTKVSGIQHAGPLFSNSTHHLCQKNAPERRKHTLALSNKCFIVACHDEAFVFSPAVSM